MKLRAWLKPASIVGIGKDVGKSALASTVLLLLGGFMYAIGSALLATGLIVLSLVLWWLGVARRPERRVQTDRGSLRIRPFVLPSARARKACRLLAFAVGFSGAAILGWSSFQRANAAANAEREHKETTVTIGDTTKRTEEKVETGFDEIRDKLLAEIDAQRIELQEASDRARRMQSGIARAGMQAASLASTNPEVKQLADRLGKLIDEFVAEYDIESLPEPDRETVDFAKAERLNAVGRHNEAIDEVTEERALREDRAAAKQVERAFTANKILGDAFYGKHEPRKALDHYQRAAHWKPEDLTVKWGIASCAHQLGQGKKAIEYWSCVISEFESITDREGHARRVVDYAGALSNRGAAYLDILNEPELALKDFEVSITTLLNLIRDSQFSEHRGHLATALSNRGNAMFRLGREKDALSDYDRSISLLDVLLVRLVEQNGMVHLNDDLANAYYFRGVTLRRLGKPSEAIGDYSQAIQIDQLFKHRNRVESAKRLASAHAARGNTYFATGRYELALPDYDRAIEIGTNLIESDGSEVFANELAGNYIIRAFIYEKQNRHENARRDAMRARELLDAPATPKTTLHGQSRQAVESLLERLGDG